jgi:nicotinate-nucleotide adenylyltransferase
MVHMAEGRQKQRIGLLGGTFDPIHYGHLTIAQLALESCRLDQLIFIPAGEPPHKNKTSITVASHRLRMVELALSVHPQFGLNDVEIRQKKPSYSINLLAFFQKLYPDADLYLVMGADSLMELETWYEYQNLLSQTHLIVMKRDGIPVQKLKEKICHFVRSYGAQIHVATSIQLNISSSQIRDRVHQHQSIRYFTPAPVQQYIETHHLYQKQVKPND